MNTLNKLKGLGQLLIVNLIPIIFLLGLTIINVASYMGFGMIPGLYVTGATLIVIVLILVLEQGKPPE